MGWYFWILFGLAMLVSSIGFKNYVWFISLGYGFSIAAAGLLMLFLFGGTLTAGTVICCVIFFLYDKDLDQPVADGFYFTIGYPGMTSGELARELMYYGVSAICLTTTGSQQQGLRVCTSFIEDHQYEQLEERMKIFSMNNKD